MRLVFVYTNMAREFAKAFYKSKDWERCRADYIRSVGGLCERCLKRGLYNPGIIVHHKTYINPDNINDPRILTDFNNLELLCRQCHADEHKKTQTRYVIDELGRVSTSPHAR